MKNYIDLIYDVLANGIEKEDRTGVGTRSVFGRSLRFDLQDGFPIVTTRKVSFRIAFEETMFFLRGQTDTKILEDKNIKIWKGNTSREFLDSTGLLHLPEGSIGKGYSHCWRNFQGDLGVNNGIDQIRELLDGLKNDPNSRRHLVTAWNPMQLHETPLPPCHIMQQYAINEGRLDSCFFMRSNDIIFGLPFNIMGYAFLNFAFSKVLGLRPGHLVYFGSDVHIYNNQKDLIDEQLQREPYLLPELIFHKEINTLEDILGLEFEDVELKNYKTHGFTESRPNMAI